MDKLMKWAIIGLGLFAVVAICVGSVALFVFSKSVAPKSGEYLLAELSSPVTVVKDEHSIPHIKAQSRKDGLRALGFLHASERLWQMEVLRMAGQGRLSEMFGKQTVTTDRFVRTLDLETPARKSVNALSAETLELLKAYADGVNAYRSRNVDAFEPVLAPEFIILNHEPEDWEPWHSLLLLKVMALTLDHNMKDEIGRLALASKGFNTQEIEELYPYSDRDTPVAMPDLRRIYGYSNSGKVSSNVPDHKNQITDLEAIIPAWEINTNASNSWAISGTHTQSGKPFLANDPHLALTTPTIFYLAHLSFNEGGKAHNIIGGTLPGTPLFLVGRNNEVAWGVTNTKLDSQDLFIERVNRVNLDQYLTADGFVDFVMQPVTIKVKGGKDVIFTRKTTVHGPILPSNYKKLKERLPIGTVAALKWTALADDDTTLEGALDISMATSVEDLFLKSRKLVSPMQSIIAGDVAGNIGLMASGRVPIRSSDNLVNGRAPVPGWDKKYDWQGYLAFDDLPKIINPENGVLVAANGKWLPNDYAHHITYDWAQGYRQDRAEALYMGVNTKQDKTTAASGMADKYSPALVEFRDIALGALNPNASINEFILRSLRGWNGEMSAELSQPLILNAWLKHTNQLIFEDDLGNDFDIVSAVRARRVNSLLGAPTSRNWCNNQVSPKFETCADILAIGLKLAIEELETSYGPKWEEWRWGKAHISIHEHRPFTHVSGLSDFFTAKAEMGGGYNTLYSSKHKLSDKKQPYAAVGGSAFRAIYDFSNLNNSGFMIATGQSGNVMSDHYQDLLPKWVDSEFVPITTDFFNQENVENMLVFKPAN